MKLKLRKTIYMMGRYFLFGIVIQMLAFNFVLAEHDNGQDESIDAVLVKVFRGSTFQRNFSNSAENPSKSGSLENFLVEASQPPVFDLTKANNGVDANTKASEEQITRDDDADIIVTGQVLDEKGEPLPGATITVDGAPTIIGTVTDIDGNYSITVPEDAVLDFSFIGFESLLVPVDNRSQINVTLSVDMSSLDEVVVVGYGTQKRQSLTGAISSISSEDIGRVRGGATVSSGLAGKLPGVSFRMPDGRPGAAARVQIRNMGDPLFVIDGIQQEVQQFNNLNPTDIESITILKDGSAAIYGVRAANGVVLVTTKKGSRGDKNTININAYQGFQNWTKFMDVTNNSYDWAMEKVQADMNGFGTTNITKEDLEKYKLGIEPGYQSFNWKDFIIKKNAPISQIDINASGGSEKINYYISGSHLKQSSVLGREFTFGRTNLISNIDVDISERLKVGIGINGYMEERLNPGIPGGDDYWLPRYAILRNTPWERPYANDNPLYLNDIKHNETNWAYNNFKYGGYKRENKKYLQTNFTGEYQFDFLEGLSARGMYSYGIEDVLMDGHEYTYETYTYYPATGETPEEYRVTGGSTNPWRERETRKIEKNNSQLGLNYSNIFGDHEIGALFLAERYETRARRVWVHAVPATNILPLLYFNTMDRYDDSDFEEARIGYITRINYNFDNKYYLEISGRRDASWKFSPDQRVGYFPSASVGWRISKEDFMESIVSGNILNDLKLRASYGILGDDNIGIDPYDYLAGYTYNQGTGILDRTPIIGTRDKGQPITNITWLTSKILDIGADFSLFNGKVNGSVDYFNRKRTGLRGRKYDIVVPNELGYNLPDENVNSDKQFGGEASLSYAGNVGDFTYSIGGNLSYARSKFLSSYNPIFFNSWDQYRNSAEDRFQNLSWGYKVIGQFSSQDEINNYPVNVDGQGNKSLLPGDLIYEDLNGDKIIDDYDQRPIGYGTNLPVVNGGLNFVFGWKNFDFAMDFSLASMYSFTADNELRRAFRANGGNMAEHLRDAWHREDPFDLNSNWIPGTFPPNRFNQGGLSSVNKTSDFWMHNVTIFRARTIQLGYSLPVSIINRVKIQQARVFVNGYNLFFFDNLKDYPIDPEVTDTNGLQYPQNRIINIGVGLTL